MNLAANISKEDLVIFLQENEELLQLLDEDIVKLERGGATADLMNEIFRAAHTIKGSSAMLGHQRMSQLAHAMENVLDGLRKGTMAVSPELIDALLISLDNLKILKEELVSSRDSEVDISVPISLLTKLAASNENPAPNKDNSQKKEELVLDEDSRSKLKSVLTNGHHAYTVNVKIDKNSSWASVRCFQILGEAAALGEIICSAPTQKEIEVEKAGSNLALLLVTQCNERAIKEKLAAVPDITSVKISQYIPEENGPIADSAPSADIKSAQMTTKTPQTVRIDVSRLDSLMEQIGELVVNRNRINQLSKMLELKYKGDDVVDDLGKTTIQTGKIVNTLQQDIMKIRMLPIEIVFNGFPRMVRDLARKAGKAIDFRIEGQETEVDRSVIEHIKDPLVHLLRNSVDHGIESPEKRKAAGKPETGTIVLSAYHEQNHIIITVTDDGKGLDPASIRSSAIKKGAISAEVAERLSDAEAIDLMFMPGVSTAEKTTEVSGRGVGLDVVKTNIESLKGTVSATSKLGKGTRFTLMLPLTLAILPSLLASVGRTLCAIPLASVIETAKLEPGDLKTIRGKKVTMWRNTVLPVLNLHAVFGWGKETITGNDTTYVVIVKAGDIQACLAVDSLREQQDIVVKSLGNFFGDIKGVAGASILGDGHVTLILDVATLLRAIVADNRKNRKERVSVAA